MGKPFHLHQLHHLHALVFAHPAQIVPRQIHQHDMLRPLLRIRPHLPLILEILPRGRATRLGSRDRPDLHLSIFTTHMGLGGRAHQRQPRHLQAEHVRRRIDRTQCPIQINRPALKRHGESLRGHHLKNISRPDMLLHFPSHLQILRLRHVRSRPDQQVPLRSLGNFHARFPRRLLQPPGQRIQPLDSFLIIRPWIFSRFHLHNQAACLLLVIENDKLLHQGKAGIRHPKVVLFCHAHGRLEVTHRLERQKTHRPAGKGGRNPRPRRHGPDLPQHFLHFPQGIGTLGRSLLHLAAQLGQPHPSPPKLHHGRRPRPHKRIPPQPSPRFCTFQKKSGAPRLSRKLDIRRNRGLRIGGKLTPDRNEVPLLRQFEKLFLVGKDHRFFGGRTAIPRSCKCRFTSGTVNSPK